MCPRPSGGRDIKLSPLAARNKERLENCTDGRRGAHYPPERTGNPLPVTGGIAAESAMRVPARTRAGCLGCSANRALDSLAPLLTPPYSEMQHNRPERPLIY